MTDAPSVTFARERDNHQPTHPLRVADGRLQSHAAAQRIAEDVGIAKSEMRDQRRDVVRQQCIGERAVNVSRVSAGLQFHGDHLPGLGQAGQNRSEHPNHTQATVQQYERFAPAVKLIIRLM